MPSTATDSALSRLFCRENDTRLLCLLPVKPLVNEIFSPIFPCLHKFLTLYSSPVPYSQTVRVEYWKPLGCGGDMFRLETTNKDNPTMRFVTALTSFPKVVNTNRKGSKYGGNSGVAYL